MTAGADTGRRRFRLGRFLVDPTPLKESPGFRLLFAARALSMLSYGVMSVAISWQVFALTGSSFQVGLVSFSLAASMMVGLLFGGSLADRYDRRRLIMASRGLYPIVVGILFVNAAMPVPGLLIIHIAVVVGGLSAGVGAPALMAATASILERHHFAAASALTAIVVQAGALIGPSIAGILISGFGLPACYGVVAAGALATLVILCFLPPSPPEGTGSAGGVEAFRDGWRFVRKQPVIYGLFLIDIAAVLFASPVAIFPQIGTQTFQGGAATVGLLYTAPAAGAFLAAVTSGWVGRCRRPGLVLVAAVMIWGLSIAATGFSGSLVLTLVLLGLAGFSDTVSEILRVALLQFYTPNGLQGRVSSLWLMQATVGPAAGGLQMGALASVFSPTIALVTGGLACLGAASLTSFAVPALRIAKLK